VRRRVTVEHSPLRAMGRIRAALVAVAAASAATMGGAIAAAGASASIGATAGGGFDHIQVE
jgi:hypothetical protein